MDLEGNSCILNQPLIYLLRRLPYSIGYKIFRWSGVYWLLLGIVGLFLIFFFSLGSKAKLRSVYLLICHVVVMWTIWLMCNDKKNCGKSTNVKEMEHKSIFWLGCFLNRSSLIWTSFFNWFQNPIICLNQEQIKGSDLF